MVADEIFESCARSGEDWAGVFEHDGETGYFYLYNMLAERGDQVVDAIHVVSGRSDLRGEDISVRWSRGNDKVGLFIRETLWAVFDLEHRLKHGGAYAVEERPSVPFEVAEQFDRRV